VSVTPVVTVAVYIVEYSKGADGVRVTVLLIILNVPLTPLSTWNVEDVIVEKSIGSEKVALITLVGATPVRPFAGLVDSTVGGVSSPFGPTGSSLQAETNTQRTKRTAKIFACRAEHSE
jgi:hypothetical protein